MRNCQAIPPLLFCRKDRKEPEHEDRAELMNRILPNQRSMGGVKTKRLSNHGLIFPDNDGGGSVIR